MCATVQLFHSDGCLVPTVVTFRTPFEVVTCVSPLHSLRQAFLDSQWHPPLRGPQLNWMISHPHQCFVSHSQDNTKICVKKSN